MYAKNVFQHLNENGKKLGELNSFFLGARLTWWMP
jgi:hypothetical protein